MAKEMERNISSCTLCIGYKIWCIKYRKLFSTMKIIKKQLWIPAGVYPCENRGGNDRGRSFRFLLPWG